MLRQIEWRLQNGPITKGGVLPVTTVFFWKICFSFRTLKELVWCTNDPNINICIFRRRWSLILGCFFPVSILKNVSSALITFSFSVGICLEVSLKVFFNWYFIRSYFSSGIVTFISSLWLLDELADLSKQYANVSSDWTVPYDFVFYSLLSNSIKNAWIGILAGLLNVSNAS